MQVGLDLGKDLGDKLLTGTVNDIGSEGLDVHLAAGGGLGDDTLHNLPEDGARNGNAVSLAHFAVDDAPEILFVPVRGQGLL